MTEHLPECPVKSVVCEGEFCHCDYAHFCNCNELRAREERIGGLITRQRAEQIGRNIGQHGCVITEQRHLPECPMLEPFSAETKQHCFCTRKNPCIHDEMECICEKLRACERRVRAEYGSLRTMHACADLARANGIKAARGAVAALRGYFGTDDSGDGTVWVEKINALSVIDALREGDQP